MPKLPIRNLGGAGVNTDVDPFNLPQNAFSRANNVRFDEGSIKRSPVFRTVKDSLGFNPRFSLGISAATTGFDSCVMVANDWVIKEYSNDVVTDRSGSITGSDDPRAFTGSILSEIVYVNREDRRPVYRTAGGTNFADLPNWDANWRAKSLRVFQGFVLALATTESLTEFPTRVRWSNQVTGNNYPDSWDATDTTKLAGFNDITEMSTPIVDGHNLRNNFVIYSEDECYLMEFIGGSFIFNFRKLFSHTGVINQNCVVEHEGRHYVFGPKDIYVHDGSTVQSLADGRVRKFIYDSLNLSASTVCFTALNEELNEVYFCFQSGDADASFPNANRCNRAAVYNYRSNTWSFMDLPNVSSSAMMNLNSVLAYSSPRAATLQYDEAGGSYFDQQDSQNSHLVMVGEDNSTDGITSDKLYGIDLADNGSIGYPLDTEATKSAMVERIGIDLDEAGIELSGYKVIRAIYPQINTSNSDKTVCFTFGAANTPNAAPSYEAVVNFNMANEHKVDSRAAGRYLSYKVHDLNNYKDITFSGFDLDVAITGRR